MIIFGKGKSGEKLLEVPLGPIEPQSTIVIKLGIDSSYSYRRDVDPVIRISDGTKTNSFVIVDYGNYRTHAPCYPLGKHDKKRVRRWTRVPATFKFTLLPEQKYGFCETAQEGGYINTGTFSNLLDLSKPLSLLLTRSHGHEQYHIRYIAVDIM